MGADARELSLENDCILWQLPWALRRWLRDTESAATLIAAGTQRMFGSFDSPCGAKPCNAAIREVPPHFILDQRWREILASRSEPLNSELEEQDLQVAAVTGHCQCHLVELEELGICAPFSTHRQILGSCGAPLVGLPRLEFALAVAGASGR